MKQKLVIIKMCLLALGILVSTIGMTDIASAGAGKTIHNPWNPPGVYLGITYDNIGLKNDVKLCQPVPTDDTSKGVRWDWCNSDFSYSLQQLDKNSAQYFPLNDLPSGGNSGRISKSEMVIAVVNILDNDPSDGFVQYSWYEKKTGGDRLMVKSQKLPVPACGGYPPINHECGIYRNYENYAYVGHFTGEIVEGGYYYVVIDTTWGQARIDFGVVPVPNGGDGDGVRTVVTPVPKVTSVTNIPRTSEVEVTPVATPDSFAYRTGKYVGGGIEKFLSGVLHGFWNELGF